jgi:hypothetical protein
MNKTRFELKTMAPATHWIRTALTASALLALAGCASTPVAPTAALQAAETAIAHAEQARIETDTSPELREARTKLTAARSAVVQEEMIQAEHLAQESRVAAELAFSKAEAAKAAKVNEDMQESIDALEVEMERNQESPK